MKTATLKLFLQIYDVSAWFQNIPLLTAEPRTCDEKLRYRVELKNNNPK